MCSKKTTAQPTGAIVECQALPGLWGSDPIFDLSEAVLDFLRTQRVWRRNRTNPILLGPMLQRQPGGFSLAGTTDHVKMILVKFGGLHGLFHHFCS